MMKIEFFTNPSGVDIKVNSEETNLTSIFNFQPMWEMYWNICTINFLHRDNLEPHITSKQEKTRQSNQINHLRFYHPFIVEVKETHFIDLSYCVDSDFHKNVEST